MSKSPPTDPPADDPPVLCHVENGLARLTLARPDTGNSIDLAVAEALLDAANALADDASVRAVMLTGQGRNFCVGGDLKDFAAHEDLAEILRQVTLPLHAAISRLARMDAPVIAAVQGSAAGAGMSLACGADLLVVAESAKFVLAYTRVGLSPDGGGSWYLPRLVGLRMALDLALTNRPLSATEAVDCGLASRVVADDELAGVATELAGQLAAGAPHALGSAKRLLRDSLDRTLETQLSFETNEIAENARRDGPEGISAFLGKRSPDF